VSACVSECEKDKDACTCMHMYAYADVRTQSNTLDVHSSCICGEGVTVHDDSDRNVESDKEHHEHKREVKQDRCHWICPLELCVLCMVCVCVCVCVCVVRGEVAVWVDRRS